MRTSESLFIELVNAYENVGEDSNFTGFSSNSITFFDDYPEDSRKATDGGTPKEGIVPRVITNNISNQNSMLLLIV